MMFYDSGMVTQPEVCCVVRATPYNLDRRSVQLQVAHLDPSESADRSFDPFDDLGCVSCGLYSPLCDVSSFPLFLVFSCCILCFLLTCSTVSWLVYLAVFVLLCLGLCLADFVLLCVADCSPVSWPVCLVGFVSCVLICLSC